MRFPTLIFLALLFAALLLSGCLKAELSTKQKLECIDLASYSKTKIPECLSQEQCFQKVEEELFAFPTTVFSTRVQSQLHSFKNHVALAWLYHGKALQKFREIQKICSSNDQKELATKVNELNHLIVKAFEEVDSANKKALAVLALEEADLRKEKVSLIKEEKIFDSFIALNNNLNELYNPAMQSSSPNSFVSHYFQASSSFQSLSQKIGFSSSFITEFSMLDLIGHYDNDLLALVKSKNIFLPILKNTAFSMVEFFTNVEKLENAIELMKTISPFEIFESFNEFVALENSVAFDFVSLMRDDFKARQELEKRNEELKEQTSEEILKVEFKISSISSKEYVFFDQNFIASLQALLNSESLLEASVHSFKDLSQFQLQASEKLFSIKQKFNSILSEEFLEGTTLGDKTSALKQLFSELKNLSLEVDFVSTELISGLEALCTSRLEIMESELKHDSTTELLLTDLKARIFSNIHSFKNSTQKTRLVECRKAVENFQSFKKALQNVESFKLETGSRIQECLQELEMIFSTQALNLSSFHSRFNALKALEQPFINPSLTLQQCLDLKESITLFSQANERIASLSILFQDSSQVLKELELMQELDSEIISLNSLNSLKSSLNFFSSFFPAGKPLLSKILPNLSEIEESLSEFHSGLNQKLESALIAFLQKNAKLSFSSTSLIEADKPLNSKLKLSFSNPFSAFNNPLSISIDFPFKNAVFESSNVNADLRLEEGKLLIQLSKLSTGLTYFVFDYNETIATTMESVKLVQLSFSKAFFEKTITLDLKAPLNALKVSSFFNLEVQNPMVFFRQNEIPFILSGKTISFTLSNPRNKESVIVYYAVLNPLSFTSELVESTTIIDENVSKQVFKLTLKNNLPITLENQTVKLPFALGSKGLQRVELFVDEKGLKVPFSLSESEKLSFSINFLQPGQEKNYFLELSITDKTAYWQSLIKKAFEELELLALSKNNEVMQKAQSIISESQWLFSSFNPDSQTQINSLNSIASEIEKLKVLEQNSGELLENFSMLSMQLEKELREFEEKIKLLQENGFETSEFQTSLSNAWLAFNNALKLKDSSLNDAIQELFKARSFLANLNIPTLSSKIEFERQEMLKEFNSLISTAEAFEINIVERKKELFELNDSIQNSLSSNNYTLAVQNLHAFSQKVKDFNSFVAVGLFKKAFSISKEIELFENLVKNDSNSLYKKLKKIISSVSFQDLVELQYVPPTDEAQLENSRLNLSKLYSISIAEKIEKFKQLFEEQEFAKALQHFNSFSISFTQKLLQAKSLNESLEFDFNKLKEDALTQLSAAQQSAKNSQNEEVRKLLEKSEQSFLEEDFLKSIQFSALAILLLSNPNYLGFSGIELPLSLVPLIAIIIVALAVKRKKKKDKSEKNKKLKRILSYAQKD